MPAPTASTIYPESLRALSAGMAPQDAAKIASAISGVLGKACTAFVERVFMAPGVLCSVTPPPAINGTVSAPGPLMGPVFSEGELRSAAASAIQGLDLTTFDKTFLTDTLVKLAAPGFEQFREIAKVRPGTPVAAGATIAPGSLMASIASVMSPLQSSALRMTPPSSPHRESPQQNTTPWQRASPQPTVQRGGLAMGGHRQGAAQRSPQQLKLHLPKELPQLVVGIIEKTLVQMTSQVMVGPGIPVAGTATAAPGRLM